MSEQNEDSIIEMLSHIDKRSAKVFWSVLVFAAMTVSTATTAWVTQQSAIKNLETRATERDLQVKELTSVLRDLNLTLRDVVVHDQDQERRIDRLEDK